MGTSEHNAGGSPAINLQFIQGGEEIAGAWFRPFLDCKPVPCLAGKCTAASKGGRVGGRVGRKSSRLMICSIHT